MHLQAVNSSRIAKNELIKNIMQASITAFFKIDMWDIYYNWEEKN